jgi:hypothetical protein
MGARSSFECPDSGATTLGVALKLTLLNNYIPAYGVGHQVLTAGGRSGTFGSATGIAVAADRFLAMTYDATGVNVTAALPGDANLDRTVNFNDLVVLAQQLWPDHESNMEPWRFHGRWRHQLRRSRATREVLQRRSAR